MGFSVNGAPLFCGTNYLIWKRRMQGYLEAEGSGVWQSVLTGYDHPKKVKTTAQKEARKNNSMAMESILEGLSDSIKEKIGKCNTAKELWLKIEHLYSSKEHEEEVMKLMTADLTDLQKKKIGKCNSIEELSLKLDQVYSIEEQKAEGNSIERSVQDPGKYEGKSIEHPICNVFEEICLSSIEDKCYSKFIDCNTSKCDESHCFLINDGNECLNIDISNALQKVEKLCKQNQVLQEQLDKSEKRNQEESEKATQTIIDLNLQVEEATRIKEAISNSLKDQLEKSAVENKRQSEEIDKLRRQLEDKEKELTRKLQDKDSEISILLEKMQKERSASQKEDPSDKTGIHFNHEIEEKIRRKQEDEIKSLKIELRKVCLTNFDFEKELSKLRKENQKIKGQMEDSIVIDLKEQIEEVKKIEEDLTRQLQEKIEICQKQELKILSLKEDLNKAVAQLKTNSKIEKNIEESESSREKEEKANSYTDIFSRSHDQQDSRKNRNRELASQRRSFAQGYPMMFNGHCYKCNNYGHKAIHCRTHDRIIPDINQGMFSVQCYNCYHYGHFAKHCRMQGEVKVWRRKQIQPNVMNSDQPTKVWKIKSVDCTNDQNRNDENIGKNPIPF